MTAIPAQPRTCSVARTLDIVGEKWALLAVREASMGNHRFDEMVRRTGAPRDTLAARLRTLVAAGILERRPYSDHPARFEYHLTEAGRDLNAVLLTMVAWGDRYLAGQEGPPLLFEHRRDHRFVAKVVCEQCGEAPTPRDLRPVPPARQQAVRQPASASQCSGTVSLAADLAERGTLARLG